MFISLPVLIFSFVSILFLGCFPMLKWLALKIVLFLLSFRLLKENVIQPWYVYTCECVSVCVCVDACLFQAHVLLTVLLCFFFLKKTIQYIHTYLCRSTFIFTCSVHSSSSRTSAYIYMLKQLNSIILDDSSIFLIFTKQYNDAVAYMNNKKDNKMYTHTSSSPI